MQRREYGRYRIWLPVSIDSGGLKDAVAVSHNVSEGGLLVATSAHIEVGAEVRVSFRLPDGRPLDAVQGRIVRIEANTEDPDGMWPVRVGIMFDELAPELIPLLEQAAMRPSVAPP